jgi:hypothetical protein
MIRAVIEIEIRLLTKTLLNSEEKLMIFPRCILPFMRETNNQITARRTKKRLCEGRYVLRLEGLVHTINRNDIASMRISAIRVMVRNLVFSMELYIEDLQSVK